MVCMLSLPPPCVWLAADAAYAIEATCHAPDSVGCFKVRKRGKHAAA